MELVVGHVCGRVIVSECVIVCLCELAKTATEAGARVAEQIGPVPP